MKKIWILFLLMMTVLSVGAQSLLPVPEWTNTPAILKGQIIGYEKKHSGDEGANFCLYAL